MINLLNILSNTTIPMVFVVVGIVLLFLALGVQLTSTIETTKVNPKQAGVLGTLFLFSGIIIFTIPHFTRQQPTDDSKVKKITDYDHEADTFENSTKSISKNYSNLGIDRELLIRAEQGDASSEAQLGLALWDKNLFAESFEWNYRAALKGESFGQKRTGLHYQNGKGVKKDYKKAVYWLEKAASTGDSYAKYQMATMYANGGYGLEQDLKLAKKWAELANNDIPSPDGSEKLLSDINRILKSSSKNRMETESNFTADSTESVDYSNGEAIFKEYGYLWSQDPVINFYNSNNFSVEFKIKPSNDALTDNNGYLWKAKPDLFFSVTNDFNKFSKIEYWKGMKSPIFIDLDTKDDKVITIQIVTENEGVINLGEAKKYSNKIFTQDDWHNVKIDLNKDTGNIIVFVNDERIAEVEKTKREKVIKYFTDNPRLYMALASWSSANFSIRDISVK